MDPAHILVLILTVATFGLLVAIEWSSRSIVKRLSGYDKSSVDTSKQTDSG